MSESAKWRMWLSRLLACGIYVPVIACSLVFVTEGSASEGAAPKKSQPQALPPPARAVTVLPQPPLHPETIKVLRALQSQEVKLMAQYDYLVEEAKKPHILNWLAGRNYLHSTAAQEVSDRLMVLRALQADIIDADRKSRRP